MPSMASRYSQRPSGPDDDKRRSFKDGWGQAPGGGGASSSAPPILEKRKREQPQDDSASKKRRALLEQRRSLPIASVAEKLVEHVKKSDTLVVIGETGSGKTTQLPQFLHSAGFCKGGMMIGITQPRRVAAITVATRVAEEMGTEVKAVSSWNDFLFLQIPWK
jgi:HrpA-like RNA helicase